MRTDLDQFCVAQGSSILDAIALMDRSRLAIALVVDRERKLLGTITDGDVRRAILANVDLRQSIETLLARKAGTCYAHPITALPNQDSTFYVHLLRQHRVNQLPIVESDNRVIGLVTLTDFLPEDTLPVQAVVMAGGEGRRLYPLTGETPKPMLPIGDRPLLEIILKQLRQAGITQVKLSLHHKSQKITDYFGNGEAFGVKVSYVTEERPLGTAGSLGLLGASQETTLVINGDILTQVDFRAMLTYHRELQADLTVAIRVQDFKVPYGVIDCDGSRVLGLREKPILSFFVNAGIYLLEPSVYRYIPASEQFDMTDLIERLLADQRPVVSFPLHEYWMDVGEHETYARAQEAIKVWKKDL